MRTLSGKANVERPVSSKFVNIDEMNEPHHHHKQKKDPEKDDR